MKFSPHVEKILKNFFSSHSKEKLIGEIDSSISNMEKDLLNFLKSDYSQLVDECSWLEEIKDKISDMKLVNLDVNKIANGLNASFIQSQEEESELDKCRNKIELCQLELRNIEKFLDILMNVRNEIEELGVLKRENDSRKRLIQSNNSKEISNSSERLEVNRSQEKEEMPSGNTNSNESLKSNNSEEIKNGNSSPKNRSETLEEEKTTNMKTDSQTLNFSSQESTKSNSLRNIESRETSFSNKSKNSLSRIIEHYSSNETDESLSKRHNDSVTHYRIAMKLIKMEQLTETISRFFFYNSFKKAYEELKGKFKEILFSDIEELIILDWCSVGQSITLSKNISLFDEINSISLLPKKNRISIFCILEMGLAPDATVYIDKIRRSAFNKFRNEKWAKISSNSKNITDRDSNPSEEINSGSQFDDLLNFYSGAVVLSYILSTKLPSIHNFHSEILEDLPKINNCSVLSIARFRLLLKKLNVNSYSFDSIIENLVFNYINSLFKHPDILKYDKIRIFQNIKKAIHLLRKLTFMMGNFDDIFIHRFDYSFIFILNNSPTQTFFRRVDEINEFSTTLANNEIFKNFKFDYLNEINRSMDKLAEREVEEISVFSNQNSTEEVVKRLIKINQTPSQEFKNKFVAIFEKRASEMYANRSKEDQALILDIIEIK